MHMITEEWVFWVVGFGAIALTHPHANFNTVDPVVRGLGRWAA